VARVGLLEAGDHPQRGRLPGTRGTEQGEELASVHLEIERVNGDHLAVALGDPDQANVGGLGARAGAGLGFTPGGLGRGYGLLLV